MSAIRMGRAHRIPVGVVVMGAVVIAAIGFAGSYAAVRDLALHKGFGWFADVFPTGVDAGIVVPPALGLPLTWFRIPFPLLRRTAWLLTGRYEASGVDNSWREGDSFQLAPGLSVPAHALPYTCVRLSLATDREGRVREWPRR